MKSDILPFKDITDLTQKNILGLTPKEPELTEKEYMRKYKQECKDFKDQKDSEVIPMTKELKESLKESLKELYKDFLKNRKCI